MYARANRYGGFHQGSDEGMQEGRQRPEVACRKANAQSLPWPVISADSNKKSPKFVSESALAEWLDQIESKAKEEWVRVRN